MATIAQPPGEFTAIPDVPPEVFTAPLKRPAQVGENWLEPYQRDY
jgi:phenylalanine-4-hydroxylase